MMAKDTSHPANTGPGGPASHGGDAALHSRADSPPSGLAPPPKHSSFYTSSASAGADRGSPYPTGLAASQGPPSYASGLPSFIERRTSDAFKHNVLPAIGHGGPPPLPMSRGVPISPREGRLAPQGPVGPSPSLSQEAGSMPYPSRSGAPSSSSRASSIASAAHGQHMSAHRDSSPQHAGPGPSRPGPSSHPHNQPPLPPPLPATSQAGNHFLSSSSSAISSFESPRMHSPAPPNAYTHRNGGHPSRSSFYESTALREEPSFAAPAGAGAGVGGNNRPHESYSPPPQHTALPSFGAHDGRTAQPGAGASRRSIVPPAQGQQASGPSGNTENDRDQQDENAASNAQAPHAGPSEGSGAVYANDAADDDGKDGGEPSSASAKGADASDTSKGANATDRKVSCLECRSSKVKCTGKTPDNTPCARCQRIGRPCIFENHRRGRRPDNLKFQKLEKSLETVTRAFADFRKLQEPGTKTTETSTNKANKQPDTDEPVKKKARRSNAAPGPSEPLPTEAASHEAGNVTAEPSGARLDSSHAHQGQPGLLDPPHDLGGRAEGSHARASGRDSLRHEGAYNAPGPAPSTLSFPLEADSRSHMITIGTHVPLPDGDLGCDPIARNVCTMREAHDFFDTFMHMQNQYFPCLDPGLHSFDFVRDRSPFLLCVVCYCAARFTEVGNSATMRLQQFIDSVLLPEILQKGLRSVEIVQGLTLLATFHDLPLTAADDRTWLFTSLAFGQAIQLGLNRRIKLPDSASVIEQRIARNGERCWLTLFLVESNNAMHLGRRSIFTIDRFISSSDAWHLHSVALPADRNIVAIVQIRRTQVRLQDLFDSTIADPSSGEPALSAYRSDIFIRTCMGELDTWKSTWYDSVSWAPHEQGVSREILFAYLSTTLMQCVLVLRTNPDSETATSVLRQASRTAVDALNVLILVDWPDLVFAINQNVVLGSYCAILALRMTTHSKRWQGAGAIDPQYIFDLVDKLIASLSRPGGTLRRSATALSYASYLDAILDQYHSEYDAMMSKSSGNYVPIKRRRGSEMNVHEFEAGPAGVTMIPKHPHTGLPTLVAPAKQSVFSDMTFFDSFFQDL